MCSSDLECGVHVSRVVQRVEQSAPAGRLRMHGEALAALELRSGGQLVVLEVGPEQFVRHGLVGADTEGLVDRPRSIEGVEAAVFFEELPENKVRVSARSKIPAIDVCKVCKQFKGGGHPMAAGARVPGSLQQVKHDFLKALDHEIRNRN